MRPLSLLRSQPEPVPVEVGEAADLPSFTALEAEWNTLVGATSDEIFSRHEFLDVWLRTFGANARLRILTGRDAAGRLTAALPLMEQEGSLLGYPVRELSAIANSHSCRWDLLAEGGEAAGAAFFHHLATSTSWDVLKLIDVPEGGKAYHLYRAAEAAGYPAAAWESQRSPYLDLPAAGEDLTEGPSTHFKAFARRRRRQLQRLGDLTMEQVTDVGVEAAIAEFFAIEQRGWKGRQGTACLQDSRTAAFYTQLAQAASRRGELSCFRLRPDGRTIAFHYGLTYGGTYYLPKLGYDEDFHKFSPGVVLMDMVLQDSLARGLRRLDLLGSDDEWKLRWSSGVRRHHWLFIFRDSAKGRLLRRAKFDWVPRVKRLWEMGTPG